MSDVQTRREARRRKILLNAENRLKKITSRDDIVLEERPSFNSAFVNATVHCQTNTSGLRKQVESSPRQTTTHNQNSLTDHAEKRVSFEPENDLRTIYQNPVPEDTDSVSEVEFTNFDERKSELRNWIIVVLALVVRYLFLLSEQYPKLINTDILVKYHANKIFVPFFIYEMSKYVFFRPFTPQSGLLNMLFMLNLGIRPENVHRIIIISRVMLQIIQDMMIYCFTFVCVDQLIDFIWRMQN